MLICLDVSVFLCASRVQTILQKRWSVMITRLVFNYLLYYERVCLSHQLTNVDIHKPLCTLRRSRMFLFVVKPHKVLDILLQRTPRSLDCHRQRSLWYFPHRPETPLPAVPSVAQVAQLRVQHWFRRCGSSNRSKLVIVERQHQEGRRDRRSDRRLMGLHNLQRPQPVITWHRSHFVLLRSLCFICTVIVDNGEVQHDAEECRVCEEVGRRIRKLCSSSYLFGFSYYQQLKF